MVESKKQSESKNNPKAIVWQIFRERYPKQVLYFVKDNTNDGKLGTVDKSSDLTCTKKYALTEGPKRVGELMWVTRSAPPPPPHPVIMLATGLLSKTAF